MESTNIALTGPEQGSYHPDGLTSVHIDQLLAEAEGSWATAVRPTSALLDGTAELRRRERREARRAFGAVVRAIPVLPGRDYVEPADEVA
ncbi:MAG TPA: hypothetical protein VGD71_16705 [Kribbella sp.]|jgi:hypothetical protein